jgi:hypothetical protein
VAFSAPSSTVVVNLNHLALCAIHSVTGQTSLRRRNKHLPNFTNDHDQDLNLSSRSPHPTLTLAVKPNHLGLNVGLIGLSALWATNSSMQRHAAWLHTAVP